MKNPQYFKMQIYPSSRLQHRTLIVISSDSFPNLRFIESDTIMTPFSQHDDHHGTAWLSIVLALKDRGKVNSIFLIGASIGSLLGILLPSVYFSEKGFGFRDVESTFKHQKPTCNGNLGQYFEGKCGEEGFRQSTPNSQSFSASATNHQS